MMGWDFAFRIVNHKAIAKTSVDWRQYSSKVFLNFEKKLWKTTVTNLCLPLTFNLNWLTVSIQFQHWRILLAQQRRYNEQHQVFICNMYELFYHNNFLFNFYSHNHNRVYRFWSSSILFCNIHRTLPFQTVKCFTFIFRTKGHIFLFDLNVSSVSAILLPLLSM